jgi:preprotein translocase subunit YajC
LSMYASQPTAPGREGPAPATTTGTAPPDAAPSGPKEGGGGLGGGPMTILIMVLPLLLIFMTMRGQSSATKKQKEIESGLKTGDTVLTQSGLVGKVTEVGETRVKLEIAPGVSVRMLKSAISGIDAGEVKTADKDGKANSADAKDAKDKPQDKKA